jgi:Putative amidase domain
MIRSHQAARIALATLVSGIALLATSAGALAYNGNTAAQYADTWWNSNNGNQYPSLYFSNDCANFLSQAMRAGGYSEVNPYGSTTDDHNWFARVVAFRPPYYSWTWSHSWSVASDLRTFELWHYPGGWDYGTLPGTGNGSTGLSVGDLYFYDFGDGYGIYHASIDVAYGYDSNYSAYYGNLVDAHTNNRYHAIWSLSPYNSRRSYTTVYLIHIDPSNN